MLAVLPGGVAVNPTHVTYVRTRREGSASGGAQPHALLIKITGIQAPFPLALHPDEAAAEAALDEVLEKLAASEDAPEFVRLPRSLVPSKEELMFLEVKPEKTSAGLTFTVGARLETDDRPIALGAYATADEAVALVDRAAEALGDAASDFVSLGSGVLIKRNKFQRIEVRADRDGSGQVRYSVLAKLSSEPRRLTVGVAAEHAAAVARADAVRDLVNDGLDEDEALRPIHAGFAARRDGVKGLRVKQQKVGPASAQQTVYAFVIVTEDDEEVVVDMLADADDAVKLIGAAAARFDGGAGGDEDEDEDEDDGDWDDDDGNWDD